MSTVYTLAKEILRHVEDSGFPSIFVSIELSCCINISKNCDADILISHSTRKRFNAANVAMKLTACMSFQIALFFILLLISNLSY